MSSLKTVIGILYLKDQNKGKEAGNCPSVAVLSSNIPFNVGKPVEVKLNEKSKQMKVAVFVLAELSSANSRLVFDDRYLERIDSDTERIDRLYHFLLYYLNVYL